MSKKETDRTLNFVLCGKGSCKCPAIDISKDKDTVTLGGKEEGYTIFTKEQFQILIDEVKKGTFEKFI